MAKLAEDCIRVAAAAAAAAGDDDDLLDRGAVFRCYYRDPAGSCVTVVDGSFHVYLLR